VFNLVSISQIKSGNANIEQNKVAALAITPSSDREVPLIGALFEISSDCFEILKQREHRYEVAAVQVLDCSTSTFITAVAFIASTDCEYRRKCDNDDSSRPPGALYEEIVGQYYSGSLWGRVDIFPVDKYLHFCVDAAGSIGGDEARDNFLDLTLLADGRPLRAYLHELNSSNPS
jgi:hypothetical protein